jgi:hypothetical protein
VALFIDASLHAQECEQFGSCHFEESVWCTFQSAAGEKVLVGCVYRSPSSTEENNKKMKEMISMLNNTHHDKICIMGDFCNVTYDVKYYLTSNSI